MALDVLVISLAALIVITDNPLSGIPLEEAIFVAMDATEDRPWKPPDDHLQNGSIR